MYILKIYVTNSLSVRMLLLAFEYSQDFLLLRALGPMQIAGPAAVSPASWLGSSRHCCTGMKMEECDLPVICLKRKSVLAKQVRACYFGRVIPSLASHALVRTMPLRGGLWRSNANCQKTRQKVHGGGKGERRRQEGDRYDVPDSVNPNVEFQPNEWRKDRGQ